MGLIKKNGPKKEESDTTENKEYQFPEEAELKECRYCRMMIPKAAKTCPNCKKRLKKSWVGLFVLILLIGAIGAGAYYYLEVYLPGHMVVSSEAVESVEAGVPEPGSADENLPESGKESGPEGLPESADKSDAENVSRPGNGSEAEKNTESEKETVKSGAETGAENGTESVPEAEKETEAGNEAETDREKENDIGENAGVKAWNAQENGTKAEAGNAQEDEMKAEAGNAQENGTKAEAGNAQEDGTKAETGSSRENGTKAEAGNAQEDETKAEAGNNQGDITEEEARNGHGDVTEAEDRTGQEDKLGEESGTAAGMTAGNAMKEEIEDRNDAVENITDTGSDAVIIEVTDVSDYTEEEYRGICRRVDYKKLLRSQETYLNAAVMEELTVVEQVDGGLFDENIYYLCKREDGQGITRYYIIRDDREAEDVPVLAGDIIRVYGQLFGSCKLPGYLVKTQPVVPALTMVYFDLLEE